MTQRRLWLLLLPYVGLLWVAFCNFRDPTLFGFSFFYWYQLAWVPLSALLTWIAYQTYMRPVGQRVGQRDRSRGRTRV